MSDDLYQQAILDRAKALGRAGRMDAPDKTVTLDNPLCGDRVTLDLKLAADRIADIRHHVRGCALCQASASLLAENVAGKNINEARAGRAAVQALFAGETPAPAWSGLEIFAPVRSHRSRQDCVRLPFEALERALAEAAGT